MRLDLNGNTELLQAFWDLPENPAHPDLVPTLLRRRAVSRLRPFRVAIKSAYTNEQFLEPYTVPEDRPVLESIHHILAVATASPGNRSVLMLWWERQPATYFSFTSSDYRDIRATPDVDFAIAVESWAKFHGMHSALLATGSLSWAKWSTASTLRRLTSPST